MAPTSSILVRGALYTINRDVYEGLLVTDRTMHFDPMRRFWLRPMPITLFWLALDHYCLGRPRANVARNAAHATSLGLVCRPAFAANAA